ncbi:MAG: AAA family ATPase [Planctomyces sp.]|nr:AAA family ATPase [Planctomyces sp.]
MTETSDHQTTLQSAVRISDRIRSELLEKVKSEFVGKDEAIDLLGLCLVAGENLFLLGPPGTAKSALVRAVASRLQGQVFDYLLTRFTEPSELFGPFDIRRLRDGELLTNTEGMLPEADVIFLDELLNANSAILNSLLMALNERVFRRGRETRRLGFVLAVGASNRLPEDDALGALFDRFLLRVRCDNVPSEMVPGVLDAGWKLQQANVRGESPSELVSIDDIRRLQRAIPLVDVTSTRSIYVELIHRLRHCGIEISDRRAVRLQRLIAASALMCGRSSTDVSDLWILRYIWDTMDQVEVLAKIVDDAIRNRPSEAVSVTTHPRSRGADAPNAEELNHDLTQIETRLQDPELDRAARSWLMDRASILLSRVEWIANDESRLFLRNRAQGLLQKITVESP